MSADIYGPVLSDLRAKHAALGELIAALENVARLNGAISSAVQSIVAAETPQAEKVPTTRTVPRVKAKPTRRSTGSAQRDTARDDRILDVVKKAGGRGVPFKDIQAAFDDTPVWALKKAMAVLVEEKRVARHGEGRGSRYWPAGTPAKEALRRA